MAPVADQAPTFTLFDEPGHLVRRAQQIAVSKFHQVHGRTVAPIQCAIVCTLFETPGVDQVKLAQHP